MELHFCENVEYSSEASFFLFFFFPFFWCENHVNFDNLKNQ